MQEEIVIPIIVFSFVLAMVGMFLQYFKWRQKYRAEQGNTEGSSLRASELQAMMQEAVEDAQAPLLARIEVLQEEIRRVGRALPPAEASLLEELPEPEEEQPAVRARRRVT